MHLKTSSKTTDAIVAELMQGFVPKHVSLREIPRTGENTRVTRGKKLSGFAPRHVRASS